MEWVGGKNKYVGCHAQIKGEATGDEGSKEE
jgi:hypothetical protein